MKAARDAGVTFIMGGDVGVFAHGDNAREMELLVHEYGFSPLEVLRQATSGNAEVFHLADRGRIAPAFSPISSPFTAIPQKMSLSCVRCTWS